MPVFFDLETGCLELRHPILQIAAIATDDQFRSLAEFECKLQFNEADADPKALELNHYDAAVWKRDAVAPKDGVARFRDFLERYRTLHRVSARTGNGYTVAQLAGWNSHAFDMERIAALFKAHNVFLAADWMTLDVMHLAVWRLRYPTEQLKSMRLTEVAAHLGIAVENAHDAISDCRTTIAIARRLLEKE